MKYIYEKIIPEIGSLSIASFNFEKDIPTIHDWVNRDYAKYWQMVNKSEEETKKAYEKIIADGVNVYICYHDGIRKFLLETYKPIETILKKHYDAQTSDRGFHILLGPAENPIPNFSWNVFKLILDYLFQDGSVDRIIVEPDVRNSKIHKLNKKAGFEYQKKICLPNKIAYLAFCTRKKYSDVLDKFNNPTKK